MPLTWIRFDPQHEILCVCECVWREGETSAHRSHTAVLRVGQSIGKVLIAWMSTFPCSLPQLLPKLSLCVLVQRDAANYVFISLNTAARAGWSCLFIKSFC